jgi:UDP-3-O-[3-hydroxymyristoyl] N-acetylglucosamine deacetylase/3-hydroxyacyl-[acyl-carrier-protein] dehydratase
MSEKQTTLNNEISLKGKGLHTGAEVTVTLKPAAADYAYKFKRTDLEGEPIIPAFAENVSFTERGTVLEKNGASVSTIEHCLSALRGMGVDNCLIEIDGPEIPIFNGSAKVLVNAIKEAGIKELEENRKYFVIKKKMVFEDKEKGIKIVALPDDQFSIDAHISFDSSVILANQYASLESLDDYEKEISNCRTFVFLNELEPLLNNMLLKVGVFYNAIIIVD